MFHKILIANRGEIACRVARTARRLGVRSVAVYSDADAAALHVATCDEAFRIGPAPARESYLRGEVIIDVARRAGAEAIHPGYGFLSENERFARAVAAAGMTFIGPPADAIRAMGSKAESKRLMERASVPLVPGYHGEGQDDRLLAAEAEKIGYPVLIKASAGGGGKGMRIVEAADAFAAALASARREASASFGDDRVLIERYLLRPRHVEIQVFADAHGGCVHLFERDCSVQRRHQKVLEEAPAPGMTAARREEMGAAAIAAARAVGYVGAGTVEFIVDAEGAFYFMEMNTRLQVEHPVTEMITGLDLVEWQLCVAAGERLPRSQSELRVYGHAVEARIYAEDTEKGFLPSVGRIVHLRQPREEPGVRIDTGVREGDAISPHYDPMIAKVVVHGTSRAAALARLDVALAQYEVVGVATNVEFLRRIAAHPAFANAEVDTGLIDRHHDALLPAKAPVPVEVVAAAAAIEVFLLGEGAAAKAATSGDPHSPWGDVDTWWLNTSDHAVHLRYLDAEQETLVRVRTAAGGAVEAEIAGRRIAANVRRSDADYEVALGAATRRLSLVAIGEERTLIAAGTAYRLRLIDLLEHAGEQEEAGGHLLAPMSGTVVSVLVKQGDRVEKGQPLVVVEAMKMEHTVVAPVPGVVEAVYYAEREPVAEGVELVSLLPEG